MHTFIIAVVVCGYDLAIVLDNSSAETPDNIPAGMTMWLWGIFVFIAKISFFDYANIHIPI